MSADTTVAAPVRLGPNQPPTFYRGAGRIAAFRAPTDTTAAQERPEDWIASTVPRFGQELSGLTTLADGRLLREAVRAEPRSWVGEVRPGEDPALRIPLVKLLDAGQRLPVHAHPDDTFARAHLGVANGKTEAWCIIQGEGAVHLGWSRHVDERELAHWVETQNVHAMLSAMNRLTVAAGDTVFVPAGLPHAIGDGILLVEVQQPADLSLLLEWKGFATGAADDSFCGLEPAQALPAVTRSATDPQELEGLVRRGVLDGSGSPRSRVLPDDADAFFTAELLRGEVALPAGYRTLVVIDGHGTLRPGPNEEAGDLQGSDITAGDTLAVPAALGPIHLDGDARLLSFAPPSRDATGRGAGASRGSDLA